jgi:hypothetical protein
MKTLGNIKDDDSKTKPDLQKAMVKYFSDPDASTDDEDVHAYAVKLGVEPEELEEAGYELLHCFFSEGNSSGSKVKPDPGQVKMGMAVEAEHSDNPLIQRKIVLDHLAESGSYYTHLAKMEESF